MGGVAAGSDITTGLPRVEELFEARKIPKGEAVVSELSGTVRVMHSDRYSDLRIARIDHSEMVHDEYDIPPDWTIAVLDETEASHGDVIAYHTDPAGTAGGNETTTTITALNSGKVRLEPAKVNEDGSTSNSRVIVSFERRDHAEYDIPTTARLLVKDGDHIQAGQPLTEGSLNPHRILRIQGRMACQVYLLTEVQKVYRSQGQNINDKHFEVIIRKMLAKVAVTRPGNTQYLPGDLVDYLDLRRVNEQILAQGKRPARFIEVLLGITKASLNTASFLSASSFQHTIKVLAGAAIASTEDPLYGLKENVIIGKLIPAGTGFVRGRFAEPEEAVAQDYPPDSGYSREEEDLADIEFSLSD
jgi:DNA-directed RNA polymerase subunit beta'